jgi:hypothetical protein
MKLIINMGLSAQVIDLPLSGETIGDLVAAGEIPDVGPIWDILKGDAGDAPVPPTTITEPSASASSVSEGTEITFVAGVYAGDEPMSVSRVLRVDGSVVDAEFSEMSYTPPITGANRVVSVTETAANAAGTRTETVTVTVQRIPVAPSVATEPAISPASPQQGDTITIVPPTWQGDTPITVEFVATFNGTDVTASVTADGPDLSYAAGSSGEFAITFSATNAAGGPVQSSALITVTAFALINTGLNLNTANIMVQGESQAASWLFDTWGVNEDPARPSHEWSQLFRAAYTGSRFGPVAGGAGPLPGGLPGIGNGAIIGPANGTWSTWNFGTFPAGNDPRNDLANYQALVIWEQASGGSNGEFADPYRWHDREHMLGAQTDFEGEWLYVERAAQQGIKSIFLAGPRQPMIDDGATPSDGVRDDWRQRALGTDVPIRVRQQFLQSRLVANGHSDVSVYILPFHQLEIRLHDDVRDSSPEKPASISSYYDYHADDTGWVNNNGHHAYMHSRLGSYADWCLAYAVLFATSPVGLPNAIGSTSVTVDEAQYLQALAWEIAQDYYPAGLGGETAADVVWEPYQGEALPALLPASRTVVEVPTATIYTDIAGSMVAANGDPVGNINGYAAASEAARPVLTGDRLIFSADPMSATLTGFAPNYGMLLVSLNDQMAEEEILFQATGGGSFSIKVDADNAAFGHILVLDYEGGWTFCGVPSEYFDGRPILVEWELRASGERTVLKVTDPGVALASDAKLRSQILTDRVLSGVRNVLTLGPPNGAETSEFDLYAMFATDQIPSDKDRLKIYAHLENIFGGPIWFPDAYG